MSAEKIAARHQARKAVLYVVDDLSSEPGSDAQPQDKRSRNQRGRLNRIAENLAELAHPDHLIDQAAQARTEEQKIDQTLAVPCYFHTAATGLPTRNAGFAPVRGLYFCARPLSTSAT